MKKSGLFIDLKFPNDTEFRENLLYWAKSNINGL